MRSHRTAMLWLAAVVVWTAGCEVSKSRNPLSPHVAGPIPDVSITAPRPVLPADGARIEQDQQPVQMEFENPSTTGERPMALQFQLSTDSAFGTTIHTVDRLDLDGSGRTTYRLPVTLESGRTYYWRTRAFDGANTGPFSSAASFSVVVPVVLGAPAPASPANGTTLGGPSTSLVVTNGSVSGPAGTVVYRFEMAQDQAFSSAVTVQTVPRSAATTTTAPVSNLALSQQYFWRVMATDGTASSAYSAVWAFRTPDPVALGAPAPTSPANGSTLSGNSTSLVVTNGTVSGPASAVVYRFDVARDAAFASMVTVQTVPRSAAATTTASVSALTLSQQYFWRVIATDGTTSSAYSATWSFRTPDAAPPPPPPSPTEIGPPRTIDINEVLSIVVTIHNSLGYDLGSRSTRDDRVAFFFSAIAAVHHGHARFNSAGPDANWCVKDAGGGRPPSDDVVVNCRTKDAWDLIGGAGANGYSFGISYLGKLPSDQNVYPPPSSARLP